MEGLLAIAPKISNAVRSASSAAAGLLVICVHRPCVSEIKYRHTCIQLLYTIYVTKRNHRRRPRANFFLGWGLSHLCPQIFFDSARKTAMLTCKVTLPDPIIISKNPGFRALYLARRNEFRFILFV